jgi:outer membrane protein assembly factor BamB
MKTIKTILSLLLLSLSSLKAQYFDNIYPFNHDVITTRLTHKNIVVGEKGSLTIATLTNDHTLLSFTDHSGKRIWSNEYDLDEPVNFKSGVLSDDGNFIIVGDNFSTTKSKGFVLKIDAGNGNTIWKKYYDYPGNHVTLLNTLTRTNEKEEYYIIAGYLIRLHQDARNQLYCMKINGADGSIKWEKRYFDPLAQPVDDLDIPNYIDKNPNGDDKGEILIAGTRSYVGATSNIFTFVIDNDGNILKKYKEYKFNGFNDGRTPCITFCKDGYLIVFDYTLSVGVLRIDAADNVAWTYNYRFPSLLENLSGSVFMLADESFNISGWGYNPTTAKKYPFIFSIDKNGIPQWGMHYIKKDNFQHLAMMPVEKTNFLLYSEGVNSTYGLLKVDEKGENSKCSNKEIPSRFFPLVNPVKKEYSVFSSGTLADEATVKIDKKNSEDLDCENNSLDKQRPESGNPKEIVTLEQNMNNNSIALNLKSGSEKMIKVEIRNIIGQLLSRSEILLQAGQNILDEKMIPKNRGLLVVTVFSDGEQPQCFKVLSAE